MAIQYIGSATGITSATLPAHETGDLILAFAFRDGSTTAPTLPSGWTNIRNDGANACAGRIAYSVATASGTASGTWTSATSVVFLIYRNINQNLPVGNTNSATAASVTVNYPALSVSQDSFVLGFAGHRSANVNLIAPTGMTNRAYVQDATDEAAGHDTNGSVASWSSTNTSVGGTAAGWRSYVVEIKPSVSASTITDSIEISSGAGEWYQTSNDWHSWAFDRSYILLSFGDGQASVSGVGLTSSISEEATNASGFATVICSHIVATAYAEDVSGSGSAQVSAESIQADTQILEIDAVADGNQSLISQDLTVAFGEVSATAVTSVDASVEITGVALASAVENVSANAISSEILQLSGNPRRYSATQFQNNVVKIAGIGAKITTGTVSALGVISISGTAVLQNVGLYSEVQTVSAEGILSISEDELILLLAA